MSCTLPSAGQTEHFFLDIKCSSFKGHIHHHFFSDLHLKAGEVHLVCFADNHAEQLSMISATAPLIRLSEKESMPTHQVVVDSWNHFREKIPEPVIQNVDVSCMSAWVDSVGIAGNTEPFLGLLPRQQAIHGRRKTLWGRNMRSPSRGFAILKVIGHPSEILCQAGTF